MECRNQNRPWADLPPELLSIIVKSITSNPITVRTFRSVCNSWRSSCPRLSHPSLLSRHVTISIYNVPRVLTITVIYALRRPLTLPQAEFPWLTPPSWFLFLREFTPATIRICKPLSHELFDLKSLPLTFPKAISSVDFNAPELGQFYNFDSMKVVMFPNGLDAVVLLDDAGVGTSRTTKEGKLGLVRFGDGNSNFKIIHGGIDFMFDDIIEFKGRVLGIDRRGRVYEIAWPSFDVKPVFPSTRGASSGRRKRLVESLGLLYLVVRCDAHNPFKFNVFELDEKKKKWVVITSLGDRSFFFGVDCSFSASGQDLGLCGENCVWFVNQSFQSYDVEDDDYIIFNKQSSKLNSGKGNETNDYRLLPRLESSNLFDIGVYHLNDDIRFGSIESDPGYSDTLWPPPPWIWPIGRLKRLEEVETAIDQILGKIPPNIQEIFKLYENEDGLFREHRQQLCLHGGLTNWISTQNLKIALNKQKQTEQDFPLLQEHTELRDTLIELEKKELLMSALTRSTVSEEERNCVDEMKSSIQGIRTNVGILRSKIRDKFVEMNDQILVIEANAKELVRRYHHDISKR